uniref:Uncharacterized protein n=1 Tax=Rhodnius prolixus TaxID=13249 RepID=T1H8A5_RHOPR
MARRDMAIDSLMMPDSYLIWLAEVETAPKPQLVEIIVGYGRSSYLEDILHYKTTLKEFNSLEIWELGIFKKIIRTAKKENTVFLTIYYAKSSNPQQERAQLSTQKKAPKNCLFRRKKKKISTVQLTSSMPV